MKLRFDTLDTYINEGVKPTEMTDDDWASVNETYLLTQAAERRGLEIVGVTEDGLLVKAKDVRSTQFMTEAELLAE